MSGMLPQPGGYGQPDDDHSNDPLSVLQDCIQALPGLLQALPDPKDVQEATKALLILAGIQTRLMGSQQGATG